MNEKNVEALAAMLVEHFGFDADEFSRRNRAHAMAAELAARGVLVPSALTDDDAEAARPALYGELAMHAGDCADFRATLERIAKGET